MATINLGAIKFNWKGAYNSSTSYAVDDVVSSGGNSYVCIQAHSNQAVGNATAYWNIMSSAGTNGTDGTNVATTITTQGDILYRDGSGLARLGYGTAGQLLKTGGSGANPSWTDAPSGVIKKMHVWEKYGRIGALANAVGNHFVWTNTNVTTDSGNNFTPLDRVNNDLMIDWQISSWGNGNNFSNVGIRFAGDVSGTNYDYQHRGHAQSAPDAFGYIHRGHFRIPKNEVIGNGSETFSVYYRAYGGGGHEQYVNPQSSEDGRIGGASPYNGTTSTLQITEFKN